VRERISLPTPLPGALHLTHRCPEPYISSPVSFRPYLYLDHVSLLSTLDPRPSTPNPTPTTTTPKPSTRTHSASSRTMSSRGDGTSRSMIVSL
jgi:hypothetical protein